MAGSPGSTAGPAIPGSRSATAPDRRLPRGRHDLPREFVAKTQRDRLIDAMAQTVAAKGYAGTLLSEVCAVAGVSTKAFYSHFADKQDCFLATFNRGMELLQKGIAGAYRMPGPWPVKIHRGLGVLLQVLAGEPAFATLAVVEVMAAGPRAVQRRQALLAAFTVFFADAPRPPQVSPMLVDAVVAGIYGVIFDHVATGRTRELPGCLPDLTYFALAPFIGPEGAAAAAATAPD